MTETIYLWVAIVVIFSLLIYVLRKVLEGLVETRQIWDYEKALLFRYGKFVRELAPGRVRHRIVTFDARFQEITVQGQELLTSDGAPVKVTAVVRWRVSDAQRFFETSEHPEMMVYTEVQLALRSVLSGLSLDEMMDQKAAFGGALQDLVKSGLLPLGVEADRVDVRDLMLGGELKGSYQSVITSRMEALAQMERARGEASALRTLANASRLYEKHPDLFRMQSLETLKELGTNGYGNTLVVGVPEEFSAFVQLKQS
ncbi:MAG: slipin family protein [Verrucomicrobiota bacterium]